MTTIRLSAPFLLSDRGSTRATAYQTTNKAVRIGDTTHVTWLDAVAGVRLRSYDHASGQWDETHELDDGLDNHTNPALTAAPDGRLRIAYGPHGWWDGQGGPPWNKGRFRLRQTVRPNDVSEWEALPDAGYGATYASLITDGSGRDHLAYRGGPQPHGAMYERRQHGGVWDYIARLSHLNLGTTGQLYTHVGPTIMVGPGDVVYAAFHYYAMLHGRSQGVCILRSEDHGSTWEGVTDVDEIGSLPVQLPLRWDRRFTIPAGSFDPRICSLAINLEGELMALTVDLNAPQSVTLLSRLRRGEWETVRLDHFMPEGLDIEQGSFTVDTQGRLLVAVAAVKTSLRRNSEQKSWGHASSECFLLSSHNDGETFDLAEVSEPDGDVANWLPVISQTGPNHDLRTPVILYTQGEPGEGCAPETTTRVHAVVVE